MIANLLTRHRFNTVAFLLICTGFLTACGGPSMNTSADVARKSLEAALTAWRDGKKPGNMEGTSPSVQATDFEWTSGRKLEAFEIIREEPSTADKRFTVKLNQGKAAPAVEATYVVIGLDPVLVLRAEDYERMLNMENNPAQKKGRR